MMRVCASGPGKPSEAGVSLDVIKAFAGLATLCAIIWSFCQSHSGMHNRKDSCSRRVPWPSGDCAGRSRWRRCAVSCLHLHSPQAFGGKVVKAAEIMHGKVSSVEHDGKWYCVRPSRCALRTRNYACAHVCCALLALAFACRITGTETHSNASARPPFVPRSVFAGLPQGVHMTRYHSLVAERASLPAALVVSAWCPSSGAPGERVVMGLRHKTLTVRGVASCHCVVAPAFTPWLSVRWGEDRKCVPARCTCWRMSGAIAHMLCVHTLQVEGVQFHPESICSEHGKTLLRNFLRVRGGTWR